jgi:hypothetical protein
MAGGIGVVTLGFVIEQCIPNNCPWGLGSSVHIATSRGSVLFVLLTLGAMAGIAALHLLQRERYGSLAGTPAFLIAFVGVAMMFFGQLRQLVFPSAGVAWLWGIGLLVATMGIVAYVVLTTEAGVVPWWCAAALLAGSPLVGYFLYVFSPGDEGLLLGVPWIVMGYAVLRAAGRHTERPSRVR